MNTITFEKHLRAILARNLLLGASTEPGAIFRRLLKAQEELGEASEAFLAITGPKNENYKGLTVDDLREEVADVFLMAADIYARWAQSMFPGCSQDDIIDDMMALVEPPTLASGFEACFVEVGSAFGALLSRALRVWGRPEGLAENRYRFVVTEFANTASQALCVPLPGETFNADERRRRYVEVLNDKLNKWARVTGRTELQLVEPIPV